MTKKSKSAKRAETCSPDHSKSGAFPNDSQANRALSLIRKGQYTEAADLLRTCPRTEWCMDLLGVCLMRCGRADQAVKVYRASLLNPGTTVIRHDASDQMKVNYATAILLTGSPSGALDILAELKVHDHLTEARVRSAIMQWVKSLSWWRRLDWYFNRIEPSNSQVPLDFEPGEIGSWLDPKRTESPNHPTAPKLAA